jgi:NADH:ubiquinone oxidoreductase subunit C
MKGGWFIGRKVPLVKLRLEGIYNEYKRYCMVQDTVLDIEGIFSNIGDILLIEIKRSYEKAIKDFELNKRGRYKKQLSIVVYKTRDVKEVLKTMLKEGMKVDQYICGIGTDNSTKQMSMEIARTRVLCNKRYVFEHIFTSTSNNATVVIGVESNKLEQETLTTIFDAAIPMERELYDMLGLNSIGNSQIRRILTDYGFKGHPLRKDFPTTGFVESKFDLNVKQVISRTVKLNQAMRDFDNMGIWSGEAQRNEVPNSSKLYKTLKNARAAIRKKIKEYKQEVKTKSKRIKDSWSELAQWRSYMRDQQGNVWIKNL